MEKYPHFRFIEHTADIGVEIYGKDLKELFENGARAFFDIITDIARVRPLNIESIEIKADDLKDLLIGWIDEFIFLFDTKHLLFSHYKIEKINEHSLIAIVKGEPLNLSRHEIRNVIKAVTYHHLEIQNRNGIWMARIIFDI